MTNMTTSTEKTDFTLTAEDRCDRCGARALVKSTLQNNGGDLLWCGHHWSDFGDAIKARDGVIIVDEREKLNA